MYLIGVAGGSGSGKTTFAKKVLKHLEEHQVEVLHQDSYYLPQLGPGLIDSKKRPNFDHPDAFDWELLIDHLGKLKKNESIKMPVYDFKTNSRTEDLIDVGPTKVIIFEGIFTLYNQDVRNLLDVKCFLQVEADIRFTRRLHRDVKERGRSLESVIEQYYDTVRPMYLEFLEPQKQFADFTVGEETDMAAKILADHIKKLQQ